jgi:N-acetylmuramoyl-L-alanine amidase
MSFTVNARGVKNFLNFREINNTCLVDQAKPKKKLKIVIDAGHGGKDSGALGKRSKEKDLTLQISNKLAAYIETNYSDVDVLTTRTTDEFIPLFRRIQYANEEKADLFISIHCNWIQHAGTKGTETFVMGLHRASENLEVAKRENASILLEHNHESNYEGYDPHSTEGHIAMSMYQNAYLDKSIAFAADIEAQFAAHHISRSRGVKQAGFAVLRRASMPAVLIEAGFLSNEEEEDYLLSDAGQKAIISSIVGAFDKFRMDYNSQTSHELNSNVHTTNNASQAIEKENASKDNSSQPRYKVQIAATKDEVLDMDSPAIKKIGRLEVVRFDTLYKYLVGSFDTREEAISARDKLIKMGYEGSFIVYVK